jgi:hypothetical protein
MGPSVVELEPNWLDEKLPPPVIADEAPPLVNKELKAPDDKELPNKI